jgi:radical SAM superfamily enzyme YgiQ (UPF0313 family)
MSRIVLIFPPEADPTQPHLSLPSLTAILRQNDYNVTQFDSNISFYHWMLSKEILEDAYRRLLIRIMDLGDSSVILGAEVIEKSFPSAIRHINEALRIQRNTKEFYNIIKFRWATSVIRTAQALYKLSYYPEIKINPYNMGTIRDIVENIIDDVSNPYLSFLSKKTVPKILIIKPTLVGISITYKSQLIPGLTLAYLLNKYKKNFHLTVGGAFVSLFNEEWQHNPEIFSFFDSIVLYEGEEAIIELVRHIEQNKSLSTVPNLIYRDGNEIKRNTIKYITNINSLPTPDFDGLPIHSYLSPEFVFLMAGSRGCYWKACAFCAVSIATGYCYREREIELVIEDITKLHDKYKMRYLFLVDDSITPNRLSKIASLLLKKGMKIKWMCHTRMDSHISKENWKSIARSGCKYLILGLESANQRILDLMNKGTNLLEIEEMLRSCSEAGIGINIQSFIGFPSERKEEAMNTINFLLSHRDIVSSAALGIFKLLKHSKVYNNPEKYGIYNVNIQAPGILATEFEYKVRTGLTKKQAKALNNSLRSQLRQAYPMARILYSALGAHGLLYLDYHNVQCLNNLSYAERKDSINKKDKRQYYAYN